jgi:hypothetical protein
MASSQSLSLGALTPWSTEGAYNVHAYAIQQALSKLQTATVVRVESCTNSGGVSPFGLVDVTPLVAQVDGAGKLTPHVTLYGIPYLRLQGGANAVICDPVKGDLGIALFASRDISSVKATQGPSGPGSGRSYDFADGMYLGGILNAAPTQYLRFSSTGVEIVTPHDATVTASGNIILHGATIQAGASPVPVVSNPFYTWFTANIMPFLISKGYLGPAPPADSVTTTFEAS